MVSKVAWENSKHLVTVPPLVFPTFEEQAKKFHADDMSLSRLIVVLLIGHAVREFASTNQKHYPDLGSNKSSAWNFCACSSEVRPVVPSQNVGCYLRLHQKKLTPPAYSSVSSFCGHHLLLNKQTYPHPPGTCSLKFKHKPVNKNCIYMVTGHFVPVT